MTYREAVDKAGATILRRDAETLLLHVAGRDRAWLLAHGEETFPPKEAAGFFALAERRARRQPLQYLTGRQEFFGLDLHVSPAVLIPRPETELLVEAVVAWARQAGATRLVDVGTGSGAIALALATALPEAEVRALDVSGEALGVAMANAERLGLERVRFQESDLLGVFAAEPGALDAVVSNPPYVPAGDAAEMQPEVRDHEPHLALFAGADGLTVYRRLIPEAWTALRPGGLLAMEFGFGQKEALAGLLQGWSRVRFQDDYAGIPRVAVATRP